MKLVVLGKPAAQPSRRQTIIATVDKDLQTTTIDCDVDIVTLGIAVAVLQEQFEAYLAEIQDPEIACRIRETTRKAVQLCG